MTNLISKHYQNASIIVIKVGSNILTDPKNGANRQAINNLVDGIAQYRKDGKFVILVSSGAVGCGKTSTHFNKKKISVPQKQALSAIGQIQLMHFYSEAFNKKKLTTAQVLLSRNSLKDRKQYNNLHYCITELFNQGAVPIINENDALATEELSIGDNDTIASLIATRIGADILILLTAVNGLLDSKGQTITNLNKINTNEYNFTSIASKSSFGTGGMKAKLDAAKLSATNGIPVIIANGSTKNILCKIITNDAPTTFIQPLGTKLKSKKSWILAASSKKRGFIEIDNGACQAITKKGKSLLPAGVSQIHGTFKAGDVIKIFNNKQHIGVGITNFNNQDTQKIARKHSSQISKILNESTYNEIIHRDNLVILEH